MDNKWGKNGNTEKESISNPYKHKNKNLMTTAMVVLLFILFYLFLVDVQQSNWTF